ELPGPFARASGAHSSTRPSARPIEIAATSTAALPCRKVVTPPAGTLGLACLLHTPPAGYWHLPKGGAHSPNPGVRRVRSGLNGDSELGQELLVDVCGVSRACRRGSWPARARARRRCGRRGRPH